MHQVYQLFTMPVLHSGVGPMDGSSLRDRYEKAYCPHGHGHYQPHRGYVASHTSHAKVAMDSRSMARHMI